MRRTGLATFLLEELGESFPHPHNAYLEWLLDNGVVGFVLMMPFYVVVLALSTSLLRDSRSPVFVAAGGAALALVLALLVGSVGSQTFYPREGAVGMWAAIGLHAAGQRRTPEGGRPRAGGEAAHLLPAERAPPLRRCAPLVAGGAPPSREVILPAAGAIRGWAHLTVSLRAQPHDVGRPAS